jgi:hypothetical protein
MNIYTPTQNKDDSYYCDNHNNLCRSPLFDVYHHDYDILYHDKILCTIFSFFYSSHWNSDQNEYDHHRNLTLHNMTLHYITLHSPPHYRT